MAPSVELMWMGYLAHQPQHGQLSTAAPPAWYFCANEADANECAQLVLSGTTGIGQSVKFVQLEVTAVLLW